MALTLFILKPVVATLLFSLVGIAYWLISKQTKEMLNNNSTIYANESARIVKIIQEGIGAIREILISGNQRFFVNYLVLLTLKCAKPRENQRFCRSFQGTFWKW